MKVRRKERKKGRKSWREREEGKGKEILRELLKQGLQGIESWRKESPEGSEPTFCYSFSLGIGLFWEGYEGIKDPNE